MRVVTGFIFAFLCFSTSLIAGNTQFVVLTFDDGPHPFYTKKIIELLDRYSVKATFFLVGKQAEKYPHLVKAIKNAGHEIGNHTYTHPRLIFLNDSEIKNEITACRDILESITGDEIKYFRPPGGRYYFSSLKNLQDMEIILWTINTDDIYKSAASIYAESIGAGDGDIILLHSSVKQTIAALPRILAYFARHDIRAVSVGELRAIQSRLDFSKK